MTTEIESDHVMYLSQCVYNMRSDWFFLFITYWQMIHRRLQTKTNKKVVLLLWVWQGNRTYDAVVKFDTYRNVQRHCAVLRLLPTITRLCCF